MQTQKSTSGPIPKWFWDILTTKHFAFIRLWGIVQKIHLSTAPQQWRYVPTDENPADHASRGLKAGDILTSNCLTGPSFLWKEDITPAADIDSALTIGDPEVRWVPTQFRNDRSRTFRPFVKAVFMGWNYSSTVAEREDAKCIIIKDLQRNTNPVDIKLLGKGAQLSLSSMLYHLDAFLDQGAFQVGGRLSKTPLPSSVKHPVVIPTDHHITKRILSQCHKNVKHQCKGLIINEIRSQGYWIIGMSRAVASYLHAGSSGN